MSDKTRTVRVAVTQAVTWPGDIDRNIRDMAPLIEQAAANRARVVLFSESAITGYDKQLVGIKNAVSLDDPRLDAIAAMAKRSGVVVVAGTYEKHRDGIYNSAIVFFPDGNRLVQRKHYIIAWENEHTPVLSAPRRREIFEVDGMRFAILICADSGIKGIHEELAAQNVDCVLAPTAGMGDACFAFRQAELKHSDRLAEYLKAAESVCFINPKRMIELNLALACCNQMGFDEKYAYFQPGHAAIIDRTGEYAALLPGKFVVEHHRPAVAVGDVSFRA